MTKPPTPEAYLAAERQAKGPNCRLCAATDPITFDDGSVASCREAVERCKAAKWSLLSLERWCAQCVPDAQITWSVLQRHFGSRHHERTAQS